MRRDEFRDPLGVDEELISRGEVVGLLFNVSDMARSLQRIETFLQDGDGEEETDEG